jgi:hypothetical protein
MNVVDKEAAEVSGGTPRPSRVRSTTFLASAAALGAAALLAVYWGVQQSLLRPPSSRPSAPQTTKVVPPELTKEAAAQLLNGALSRRPVVARIALGDVVTIGKDGKALPLYPQLAQAQIVRLRFCRFPGGQAAANQICLADLTDEAKPYVHSGGNPFKAILVGSDEPQPKNRSFAELVLAVPRVSRVTQIVDHGRGEKQIRYTGAFELTPLAAAFGLSSDVLPPSLVGTTIAREGAASWSIETDGLQ